MIFLLAKTDAIGNVLKKLIFIKAFDKEAAFKKARKSNYCSESDFYSLTELSDEESFKLKKNLKKKMKKTLVLLNIFEVYCEITQDDENGIYTKIAEKKAEKYIEKRIQLEKQFYLLGMKVNPNW
jgi:hypothetical protein